MTESKPTRILSGLQVFIISVSGIILGLFFGYLNYNNDTEIDCRDNDITCVSQQPIPDTTRVDTRQNSIASAQPRQAETDNQLISDCRTKFNSKMNDLGVKRKVQSFPAARVQDNGDGTKFVFIYYRVLDPVAKVWKSTSLRCHLDKNQQLHNPVLAN